jgi:hypothetical protein
MIPRRAKSPGLGKLLVFFGPALSEKLISFFPPKPSEGNEFLIAAIGIGMAAGVPTVRAIAIFLGVAKRAAISEVLRGLQARRDMAEKAGTSFQIFVLDFGSSRQKRFGLLRLPVPQASGFS